VSHGQLSLAKAPCHFPLAALQYSHPYPPSVLPAVPGVPGVVQVIEVPIICWSLRSEDPSGARGTRPQLPVSGCRGFSSQPGATLTSVTSGNSLLLNKDTCKGTVLAQRTLLANLLEGPNSPGRKGGTPLCRLTQQQSGRAAASYHADTLQGQRHDTVVWWCDCDSCIGCADGGFLDHRECAHLWFPHAAVGAPREACAGGWSPSHSSPSRYCSPHEHFQLLPAPCSASAACASPILHR